MKQTEDAWTQTPGQGALILISLCQDGWVFYQCNVPLHDGVKVWIGLVTT